MLAVHSEQLHKTGYPTVHAVVLLEGTMNLTGETQPLVEQLMMVKRMQVGVPELFLCQHVGLTAWGQWGGFFWYFLGRTGFPLIGVESRWLSYVAVPFRLTSLVLTLGLGSTLHAQSLSLPDQLLASPGPSEYERGWAPF